MTRKLWRIFLRSKRTPSHEELEMARQKMVSESHKFMDSILPLYVRLSKPKKIQAWRFTLRQLNEHLHPYIDADPQAASLKVLLTDMKSEWNLGRAVLIRRKIYDLRERYLAPYCEVIRNG